MSISLTADTDVLRRQFFALRSRDDIARLLDVDPRELRYYLYKAKRYRTFSITKRSGAPRVISSPDNSLKIIQRKLNQVLHAVYERRSPVHGFVHDRSIKSNAIRHLGAEWVLNFDLENFFPSIHFGRVKGLFSHKPYFLPEQAAQVLAQICCHMKMLPAGAPTSPIVANMLCARMDAELKKLAKNYGCVYTRYADDITFSTKARRFAPMIVFRDPATKTWVLGDELRAIVKSNLFAINEGKTRVRNRHSRQEVTGLRINKRLNVSRGFIRQVRAMIHAWETYGEPAAEQEFLARYDKKQRAHPARSFRAVLRGKMEFIGFVRGRDDDLYVKLLTRFLFLDDALRAQPIVVGEATGETVVSQAVWLLFDDEEDFQGTAFAVEGGHLLTAAHCIVKKMWATRPGFDNRRYRVVVKKIDEVRDLAQVSIEGRMPVALRIGSDDGLAAGTAVSLWGFPNFHVGDSIAIRKGSITQSRAYVGVPHYIIDVDIVRGNSGGPVLNHKNEVVGIAVKGLSTPGIFNQYDQLSSFVPVRLLQYMKDVPADGNRATP
jgi:RNA-directed DNA polymerase